MKNITAVQKQHNKITAARYEYTVWEKRIIYQVIRHIQLSEQKGAHQTNLFEDLIVRFSVNDILQGESTNYHVVKKAVRNLHSRTFEMENNDTWLMVGFINWAEMKKGSGHIEIEISKKILPYLRELASNFTTYSPVVAMALKSIYSQRFYEFCSRFKDTGHWNVSIDDLRNMLKLDDKYQLYGSFKSRVLETARKELQELYNNDESDICFGYTEVKTKKNVTHLQVWIKWKKKNKGIEEASAEEIQKIHDYLNLIWPEAEGRRKKVFTVINKAKAFKEFIKKVDEITNSYQGRRPSDLGGIITKALRNDLGLNV